MIDAEPLRQRVDSDLHVALERERGVLEPAFDDVLDPRAHGVGIASVGDEREPVRAEREGADVVLDRGLDDTARELEVALVEGRVDDRRLLDQVDDLGQHGIRVAPLAERVEAGHDRRSPLLGVGLDVRGAQCVRIPGRVPDLDRLGEEPVAVRALADDPRRVEHREPPAHGTRKAKALVVPAHGLREPEGADELLHLRGQHLGQRLARDRDPEETVALLELVRRDAVALREPGRGLVPHRHRRALHPLVGRLRRDVVREHGQTARRDQDPWSPPRPGRGGRARAAGAQPPGRRPRAAPRSRSQPGASPSAPT